MKHLFTISFIIFSSLCAFSHRGDYLVITNVKIAETKDSCIYSFLVQNVKQAPLSDVQIEFWINEKSIFQKHYNYIPGTIKIFAEQFVIDKNLLSPEKDKVQIEITQIFGKRADWGGWDAPEHTYNYLKNVDSVRQTNTFYAEFYADAPWRMKKTDANGNLQGIPIHFFLHDADLEDYTTLSVDKINIQLKNANASSFGPVLTFNTIPDAVFKSYFSCLSPSDANLDIKQFSLNSFISSNASTIDFNEVSGWVYDYVPIVNKYWYFTFNMPPSALAGMDDVIDILVTIKYANTGWSDNVIGMRVFRSDYAIPSLTDYYRGDTHLHSMYTQNSAELGLPLCATKEAAKLIGLDWITTTDHTSDFDNYGISISSNWARIQAEAQQFNNQDTSLIYIAGQELAATNSSGKLVHFLAYPNPDSPYTFPFLGDGGGDTYSTSVSVNSALLQMNSIGAFGYAAHPFATGDKLSATVNGGIWNLGHPDFPANGDFFPRTNGNIICNDTTIPSDIFSTQQGKLIKNALKGAQIWNEHNTLETTGDQLDPWDVDNSGGSFTPIDTSLYSGHIKRFRQGQEIVNFINQLGLSLKNQNPNYQNWKFNFSAGADAHGSFNSSNTGDFLGIGTIDDNAVGKLTTAVYCPNGMGQSGKNILSALYNGRSTLSDGPLLVMGISSDGANVNNDIFMGDDVIINNADTANYYINFDYSTTPEFGDVVDMIFSVGTSLGEQKIPIAYSQISGTHTIQIKLTSLLETVFGTGNIPQGNYFYIRSEMQTFKNLTGQTAVYRKNYSQHNSFTNPIWLKFDGTVGIVQEQEIKQFYVSPNPSSGKFNIGIANMSMSQIEVYDLLGKIIYKSVITNQKSEIDLSAQPKGMYFYRITNEQQLIGKGKIIIQ